MKRYRKTLGPHPPSRGCDCHECERAFADKPIAHSDGSIYQWYADRAKARRGEQAANAGGTNQEQTK